MHLVLVAALVVAVGQGADGADAELTGEEERELKQEVKAAQEQATAAQEQFAQLKSGTLLSMGFTGGLALSMQVPSPINNSTARQTGVKTTTMPYVMLLPAYWGAPEANRHFCASSWSSGDEDSATEAALAITRRQAERLFKAAIHALKAGLPDEEIVKMLFAGSQKAGQLLLPQLKQLLDEGAPDFEARSQYAITTLANAFWAPTLRGDCGLKKVGIWFGLPTSYSAKSQLATDTLEAEASREYTPQAAFGLGFAPNAYFSILAGLTVGTFKTISVDSAPGESDLAWSGTIAVGGNLDLVGALFK